MAKKHSETRMQRGQSVVALIGLIAALSVGFQMPRPRLDLSDVSTHSAVYVTLWVLNVPVAALLMLVWGFGSRAINRLGDQAGFRLVLACWVPIVLTVLIGTLAALLSIGEGR